MELMPKAREEGGWMEGRKGGRKEGRIDGREGGRKKEVSTGGREKEEKEGR